MKVVRKLLAPLLVVGILFHRNEEFFFLSIPLLENVKQTSQGS